MRWCWWPLAVVGGGYLGRCVSVVGPPSVIALRWPRAKDPQMALMLHQVRRSGDSVEEGPILIVIELRPDAILLAFGPIAFDGTIGVPKIGSFHIFGEWMRMRMRRL